VSSDWNFLAGRLNGDGTVTITETELPISISSIESNLSAPSAMRGTISQEVKRLKGNNGRPIFEPFNTVILAEASGILKGYGMYRVPSYRGSDWELDIIGLPGYALGMPYDGDVTFVQEDPLNIFRHIWGHLQSFPMGNLGITSDTLNSPVRVGRAVEAVEAEAQQVSAARSILDRLNASEAVDATWGWTDAPDDVTKWKATLLGQYKGTGGVVTNTTAAKAWLTNFIATHTASSSSGFEDGPRRLNWWTTTDLGAEIDTLARTTPFDWVERVSWGAEEPLCHIELGHPTIGSFQRRQRFELGVNMMTEPTVTESDFLNSAIVLGNGEGRDRVVGRSGLVDGRIRRVRTVSDESLFSRADANKRAQDEVAASRGFLVVDQIEVSDAPGFPLASIELGNEYRIFAEMDHATVDDTVRVVGKVESPDRNDSVTLTVIRSAVAE
jgi:hypothetical protein